MSTALSYLIKARPEAMTAYFTFLKDTGKHLARPSAAYGNTYRAHYAMAQPRTKCSMPS